MTLFSKFFGKFGEKRTNYFIPSARIVCYSRAIIYIVISIVIFSYKSEFKSGIYIYIILLIMLTAISFIFISYIDWYMDFRIWPIGIFFDVILITILYINNHLFPIFDLYTIYIIFQFHVCTSLVLLLGIRQALLPIFILGLATGSLSMLTTQFRFDNLFFELVPFLAAAVAIGGSAWIASQLRRIVLPRFIEDKFSTDVPMTTSMLEFVRKTSGATDAVLCWFNSQDARCYSVRSGVEDLREPRAVGDFSAVPSLRELVPMIFDVERQVSLTLGPSGEGVRVGPIDVPGSKLFKALGVVKGICMPLDVESDIQPWLIVAGIPRLSWGHMALAQSISTEIAIAANWFEDALDAKADALRQLRLTVAADLHDSVAQSLAGAIFLLAALKSKLEKNSPAYSDVIEIRRALDAERLHVRSLIRQLRIESKDNNEIDLVVDLRTVCEVMKSRWGVDIIMDSDFRIFVPMWFSLEMQQIVREAISNGVRHGGATKIVISCRKSHSMINIEIKNNIIESGEKENDIFDPKSIRERLTTLGGMLEVHTSMLETMLIIRIPIDNIFSASQVFDIALEE